MTDEAQPQKTDRREAPRQAPPGWYEDLGRMRYWDGSQWIDTGTPEKESSAGVFTILGFVLGGIAFLFFPILFGPAGIACAAIGRSKGDRLGNWALAVAIVGMIGGFIVGALVYTASN